MEGKTDAGEKQLMDAEASYQEETLVVTITADSGSDGQTSDLQPGTLIDDAYLVLCTLGRGGMGNVYRVQHKIMKKEYALKTLNAERISEQAWRRFQTEAQAIARLDHPNVVGISNFGFDQNKLPYYVMDLLEGKTLQEVLEKRRLLPVHEALPIFIEVCTGIGYAHKKGVVHRDIKPANIVILDKAEERSKVKIVDFGIAKLSLVKDADLQRLTTNGQICGSPLYMSPEQAGSERIDARTDIYSLGCTLFETLIGSPPFRGETAMETLTMHQYKRPPTLFEASGGKPFPGMLEGIVACLLAKQPMDRYQNMEFLASDLAAVLAGEGKGIRPFGAPAAGILEARKPAAKQERQAKQDRQERQEKLPSSGKAWARPALLAVCAAAIFGLSSSFFYGLNHKPNAGRPQGHKVETKQTSDKATQNPDDTQTFVNSLISLSGEGQDAPPNPNSLGGTEPFCQRAVTRGKPVKVFHFPHGTSIGMLRDNDNKIPRALCMDKVEMPDQVQLVYLPVPLVERYPQLLKRFRAGDLYGISPHGEYCTDQLLTACTNIPGLRKIKLENCSALTHKSLATMAKFEDMDELYYGYGPFNQQDLISLPRFKHLRVLTYLGPTATELLAAARTYNRLECVNLTSTPLSGKDLELLSGLTRLTELYLGPCHLTGADINRLAKLPIKGFHFTYQSATADAFPALKQIKSLERIGISGCNLDQNHLKKLCDLPNYVTFE